MKVAVRKPDEVIWFLNWPILSSRTMVFGSRTMVFGSTKSLTEMSTRILLGVKGQPRRKADNITTICEPIVKKMWDPRRLATLWSSTACYVDSFIFLHYIERTCIFRWSNFVEDKTGTWQPCSFNFKLPDKTVVIYGWFFFKVKELILNGISTFLLAHSPGPSLMLVLFTCWACT
jgi:hypothetical protein